MQSSNSSLTVIGSTPEPLSATANPSMLPDENRGEIQRFGWGGRIRTFNLLIQSDPRYRRRAS
jgi:hypothetical protein